MNTLFDLNDIPEKDPSDTPQPEFVITFTDDEGTQWFYVSGIESDGRLRWVKREDRKQPKRYKTMAQANRVCRELNKSRTEISVAMNIAARVVVWHRRDI